MNSRLPDIQAHILYIDLYPKLLLCMVAILVFIRLTTFKSNPACQIFLENKLYMLKYVKATNFLFLS